VSDRWKVTAIVSAFKSERFLRGCLDDLESQTIADRLEIIVVNSGSPQGEHEIVTEYMRRYDNIVYVHTPWTESLYAAWNRGVQMAGGEYVTNANTDDRHRSDALEVLSRALDEHPEACLAYAGYRLTHAENETFDKNTSTEDFMPLRYDRSRLLRGYCFPGPQPMWRRSLHEEFGLFDGSYRSAGDYEFWLRISKPRGLERMRSDWRRRRFLLVPETLGLYLKSPDSVEHSNPAAQDEACEAVARHRWVSRVRRSLRTR
jgi:glycosyltransferase involved in cell wall biosynthesis